VTGATTQVGTSTVNKFIFANDNQGAMSEVGKYTGSDITAVTCLRLTSGAMTTGLDIRCSGTKTKTLVTASLSAST
jgi:hypothetical protein